MLNSHKQIIKHREVVEDDWSVLRLDEGQTADTVSVPEGKIIVPLAVWQALKGLTVFSETYQASSDQPLPLFRRAPRGTPPELTDVGAGI